MTASETQPVTYRERGRAAVGYAATVLSGLFVLAVLIVPGRPDLTPWVLLRIPVEGLLGLALLLVLRGRWRVVGAAVLGVLLGLWGVVRLFDFGFQSFLARPFDPVHDWRFLSSAMEVAGRSLGGRGGAIALAVVIAVLIVAVAVLAVLRLAAVLGNHRVANARVLAALTVVWVGLRGDRCEHRPRAGGRPGCPRPARSGPGEPERSLPGAAGERRLPRHARRRPVDRAAGQGCGPHVRGELRASALENPELGPTVGAVLDEGTRGWRRPVPARSAFLTSPTVSGGGSWLAHATLQSGLWVANQHRYDKLVAGNRLTLTSAFQRAGWHTVSVMPASTGDWPAGRVLRLRPDVRRAESGHAGPGLHLRLPRTSTCCPPSSSAERVRREGGRDGGGPAGVQPRALVRRSRPVLAGRRRRRLGLRPTGEPRAATPSRSCEARPLPHARRLPPRPSVLARLAGLLRADLRRRQPGPHLPRRPPAGAARHRPDAGHDAPVSIVARDPACWTASPAGAGRTACGRARGAPVWRMDPFRDRFLTAFQ